MSVEVPKETQRFIIALILILGFLASVCMLAFALYGIYIMESRPNPP